MSNTERSALRAPESSGCSDPHRIALATEGIQAPDLRAGGAARNPFASFAPPEGGAARDMNVETKLYEVPRELIEIARARANGAEPPGATTPLAPRPDAELEATLRAYTARLSTKPPRVPSLLLREVTAADATERHAHEPDLAAQPEPSSLEQRRPSPRQPDGDGGALTREARAGSESRAWMVYAALCLVGLASCAHVLFAP